MCDFSRSRASEPCYKVGIAQRTVISRGGRTEMSGYPGLPGDMGQEVLSPLGTSCNKILARA